MISNLLLPLFAVGLAEIGDKSQLTVLCLSSKTKNYLHLFLGVLLAFILVDGLAILLGDIISKALPMNIIRTVSGLIFIVFGIVMLRKKEEKVTCSLKNPMMSGFSLIFLSEMGDKTQFLSGLFAAQYNSFLVFCGIILVLAILSAMTIFFGHMIYKSISQKTISMVSGILFVAIGVLYII